MDIKENWSKELDHETEFWNEWFKTEGLTWGEDYHFRIDPDASLQQHLHDCLPSSERVHILDVGAGPLTVLGKKYPGKKLIISAVDPMADSYDKILIENNVEPLVRTKYGIGEKLIEQFNVNCFDIVYCQNALDHSYDPVEGIKQMLAVCKKGGYVVLFHETNEGVNEGYKNLHQWNFCKDKGHFVIWNNNALHDIDVLLDGIATVNIVEEGGYNTVKINKL
jgi:SAM-dependent methyltransferase